MAMSGIATRKYIRSLMDRPRDPMAPPLFRGGRCELLHIASQLSVKTARIAHNRHPPRAKNNMRRQAASLGYCHCVLSPPLPLRPQRDVVSAPRWVILACALALSVAGLEQKYGSVLQGCSGLL